MKSLWANIFQKKDEGDGNVIAVIKNIPVFKNLSRRELEAVERILHRRMYKMDELIFKQGDAGVGMYIIEKGQVAIRLEPSQQVVAELSDGEFFGELSLLDDAPRSATAVAITDCKMLGFFQSDLLGLIDRNPKMGVKIVLQLAKIIGERLRAANKENQELQNQIKNLQKAEAPATETKE
ncbi:MAG: cyclic nucleotide-binding domain-containing protein [Calditrichia bacterium]